MRNILLTLLLLLGGMSVGAEDFHYLIFRNADGTELAVNTEQLELSIEDGELIANSPQQGIRVKVSQLSKMYFSNKGLSTGIDANSTFSNEKVTIFNLSGIKICSHTSVTDALNRLSPGVYLIQTQGNIQKIVVK